MTQDAAAGDRRRGPHVLMDLGLTVAIAGDELRGVAPIVPEMHVPGTDCLRTSVLVAWVDTIAGMLPIEVTAPRIPVTLDLSVELERLPRSVTEVTSRARIIKAGRSTVITEVDLDADGEPLAVAMASFMPTPDPAPVLPSLAEVVAQHTANRGRLTMPYADRAGCERLSPGVARLARSDEGLNAVSNINGALIAIAVEEAVLSAAPGATLSSLTLRYLRAARVGPVVATADLHGDLARVEVRDVGSDNRLVVVATARVAVVG